MVQTRLLEPEQFPWFDYKRYWFSLGLAVGENCYLSGHTASAYAPERKRVVVETIEYTTAAALPRYRQVAEVRKALLTLPYPASTGPVCEAMVRPEMLIEVDATAVLG